MEAVFTTVSPTYQENCRKFKDRFNILEDQQEYISNKFLNMKRGRILFGSLELCFQKQKCYECEKECTNETLYLVPEAQHLNAAYCEDCHKKRFPNCGWEYHKSQVKDLIESYPIIKQ